MMADNPLPKPQSDAERRKSVKEIARSEPGGLIGRAYKFSEKAHGGQKRKGGGAYFEHPLAAAETLNQWHLDETTVAAALLHDTVEDTGVPLATVRKEFGDEVAFLVDGVTKLGHIKYRGAQGKVENLRKMILALSQDLRVVFIKLADRLHNMKTIGSLPPPKQKRIALETDEIYAPLAYRLGMQNLSGELHDLAFPILHPKENEWLRNIAVEKYEERGRYLKKLRPVLEKNLRERGILPLHVDFRAKRYSSLYNKLLRHDMDIEKIHDLVAMRIIVKTIQECYTVLGLIHELWPPAPGRIKDYIAMPKPNTYRSLHTTVIGPEKKLVEFQIRTEEMHEENEYGVAAHWLYQQKRESRDAMSPKKITEEIRWVQQLKNWLQKYRGEKSDSEELLKAMKIDFFKDRIFVITPRGDVVDLPAASTPVDFAYQIHSEIGDSCVGAKINGQIAPLDKKLASGDMVEILTQKNKKPSEDWLKFVKTAVARDRIKSALRGKNKFAKAARAPNRAELKIVVEDRVGLIKDISAIIARSHINILNFEAKHQPGGRFPVNRAEIATTDKEKLEKLILKIKQIKGVREISYKTI